MFLSDMNQRLPVPLFEPFYLEPIDALLPEMPFLLFSGGRDVSDCLEDFCILQHSNYENESKEKAVTFTMLETMQKKALHVEI